jgi:hypothetical protein
MAISHTKGWVALLVATFVILIIAWMLLFVHQHRSHVLKEISESNLNPTQWTAFCLKDGVCGYLDDTHHFVVAPSFQAV